MTNVIGWTPGRRVSSASRKILALGRASAEGRSVRSCSSKGILFCPCGSRMVPYNSRRGGKRYHYYACVRYRREGPGACEHRKNWPAETLEWAAREYVLELLRNPERKIGAWASRLAEIDHVRLAYQRQQAEGLMTLEELRAHLSELDERRTERYRGVYTTLGLRMVAHQDGALELTWKAGEGVSEACASPRCTVAATTF